MFDKLIAQLNAKREAHVSKISALRTEGKTLAARETMSTEEQERSIAIVTELSQERSGLAEVEKQLESVRAEQAADQRAAEQAEERHPTGVDAPAARVTHEPNPVYRKGDTEHSYFRDLYNVQRGDNSARDRLERAQSTSAGAGGEFAPPAWLVEDFAEFARAGRVAADQVPSSELPAGISSVNIPKISAGSGVAVVQTQNTTVTEVNMTTTSVSSGITEIAGKQTASIALLRQSGVPIDDIILGDLAAAYAAALDVQVISGSGTAGQLRGLITAGTTITYTTTQPAVVSATAAASFYSKILGAKSAVESGRKLPADKIIMTPTRWNWVLSALDTGNRPLVVPNGPAFNQPAVTGEAVAEGYAGTLLGLPVYTDPNIPANIGAATNQDVVFVLRSSDIRLWETAPETRTFEATLAADNSILFRVLGFAAFIPDRHQASVQVINGTGLVAPTF